MSSAFKGGVPNDDKPCPTKKAKKHPKKPVPNTKGKKCGFPGRHDHHHYHHDFNHHRLTSFGRGGPAVTP